MTSTLTYAVRLLREMVSEEGEIKAVLLSQASRLLGVTADRAPGVIQDLERAGFVSLKRNRVRPTVAGVALGVEVATSLRELHERALTRGRPFWTYAPKEVKLDGTRS